MVIPIPGVSFSRLYTRTQESTFLRSIPGDSEVQPLKNTPPENLLEDMSMKIKTVGRPPSFLNKLSLDISLKQLSEGGNKSPCRRL